MAEKVLVTFAEGTVKTLIDKLVNLLADEVRFLRGVRDDIQFMKDELESMHAFLSNLASREDHDVQVKTWMKHVREMAYDTEDCIDRFMHHTNRDKDFVTANSLIDLVEEGDKTSMKMLIGAIHDVKDSTSQCLYQCYRFFRQIFSSQDPSCITFLLESSMFTRHDLGTKIQGLKKRAEDIAARRARYVGPVDSNNGGRGHRSTPSNGELDQDQPLIFVDEEIISGTDDTQNKLVQLLTKKHQQLQVLSTKKHQQLQVLSIVGHVGAGKTTLAMQVFRVLRTKFQLRASSKVSNDVRSFLTEILRQVNNILAIANLDHSTETEDEMATKLHEKLKGKKYLIVMDDVMSLDDRKWALLKSAFPDDKKGSRIIITTRDEEVVNSCRLSNKNNLVHEIKFLEDNDARELFNMKYCEYERPGEGTSHSADIVSEMGPIADKILKKCGGMPLAIVKIAQLLATKGRDKEEWQKLCDSFGSVLENHPALEVMRRKLSSSYKKLPYHLKSCFLYLSIYPENYEIRRKNVVRRWVAEGFVSPKRGLTAEEVAETCFKEFIDRSMILRSKVDHKGKVKTCMVHNIMLEQIISKSVEENFVTVIGETVTGLSPDIVRRLSAQTISMKERAQVVGSMSQVRSFTAFGDVDKYIWSLGFELLRVLDLEGCKGLKKARFLNMHKLFLLRFLSLRDTDIAKLPEDIGNLQQLETLDIRGTEVKKLPVGITRLGHMSCLLGGCKRVTRDSKYYHSFSDMRMPRGFQNMRSLQILSAVRLPDNPRDLKKLNRLTKLRKLGLIIHKEDDNCKKAFLTALEKLETGLRSLFISSVSSARSLQFLSPPTESNDYQFHFADLQSLQLQGTLVRLPPWISGLQNVSEITLCYSQLEWEASMRELGLLPNLLVLVLQPDSINFQDLESLDVVPVGFRALKTFVFETVVVCPTMNFGEGSMPAVKKIKLFLKNIGGLHGLKNLKDLKEVSLQRPENNTDALDEATVQCVSDAVRDHASRFRTIPLTTDHMMWILDSSTA